MLFQDKFAKSPIYLSLKKQYDSPPSSQRNTKSRKANYETSPKMKIEDKLIKKGIELKLKKAKEIEKHVLEMQETNRYIPEINDQSRIIAESATGYRNPSYNVGRSSPRLCSHEQGNAGELISLVYRDYVGETAEPIKNIKSPSKNDRNFKIIPEEKWEKSPKNEKTLLNGARIRASKENIEVLELEKEHNLKELANRDNSNRAIKTRTINLVDTIKPDNNTIKKKSRPNKYVEFIINSKQKYEKSQEEKRKIFEDQINKDFTNPHKNYPQFQSQSNLPIISKVIEYTLDIDPPKVSKDGSAKNLKDKTSKLKNNEEKKMEIKLQRDAVIPRNIALMYREIIKQRLELDSSYN
ncbi:unnamed protein product [Blepharisma stoltei]|uniref:Uncharacterized protein n=1 Tax=Blepharisma stoltei TaxID=1481888 RepID=A0AAU9K1Y3_9CILI|nr:unnamed protein product [Blepharisma stoltei]